MDTGCPSSSPGQWIVPSAAWVHSPAYSLNKSIPGLSVDREAETLDTTTARKTTYRGLCDTLDIVTHDLDVPLWTPSSETLGADTTCRLCQKP